MPDRNAIGIALDNLPVLEEFDGFFDRLEAANAESSLVVLRRIEDEDTMVPVRAVLLMTNPHTIRAVTRLIDLLDTEREREFIETETVLPPEAAR